MANAIYLAVLLLATSTGLWRYSNLDTGSRIIVLLLAFTLLCESVALYLAETIGNKNPIWHIFNPIQPIFLLFYLDKMPSVKMNALFKTCICLLLILFGFLNALYLQKPTEMNTNTIMLGGFANTAMSLLAFYSILTDGKIIIISKYQHFWFWTFIFIFSTATFLFWGFYPTLREHREVLFIAVYTHYGLNIITYLGFAIVLALTPRFSKVTR